MTCIVGLRDNKTGKVFLGGDSATTKGGQRRIRAEPKVYKKKDVLLGGAGFSAVNQVLSHLTARPPMVEGQTQLDYILNEFIPTLKDTLRTTDQLREKDGVATTPNEFLIAFRGELFEIGCDFNVFTSLDNYLAVGSGGEFALGSLFATESSKMSPQERILNALMAACKHDSYVGGPLQIINEDGEEFNYSEDGILQEDK